MPLVATASKSLRVRYLIIIVACFLFAVWFAYDGFKAWPAKNDEAVRKMIEMEQHSLGILPQDLPALEQYNQLGWDRATRQQQAAITDIVTRQNVNAGWHSRFEIQFQQWTVYGLLLATVALIAWFIKVQRRRAVADDTGLSPQPGLTIPWDSITKIDNRRWKTKGIVDLEYRDSAGQIQKTKLDDFLLDDLPPLLNDVLDRAKPAQFIAPAGEAAVPAESAESADPADPASQTDKP